MSLECGWKAADSSGGKWVSLSQEKWRIGQNRIRNLYWHCFIGTKWGHGQTWKLKEFGNGSCQMWQSLVLTQNQHPWPAICKTFVPDVYHCKRTLSRTCLVVWRHQYIYIYIIYQPSVRTWGVRIHAELGPINPEIALQHFFWMIYQSLNHFHSPKTHLASHLGTGTQRDGIDVQHFHGSVLQLPVVSMQP